MEYGDNLWPIATPVCRMCGGDGSSCVYRTRGLCVRCYRIALKECTTYKYPKIPKGLKDTDYYAMLRNPRRYVGMEFGFKHSQKFETDAEILAEARNIWKCRLARWRDGENSDAQIDRPVFNIDEIAWSDEKGFVAEPESIDDPPAPVDVGDEAEEVLRKVVHITGAIKEHFRGVEFVASNTTRTGDGWKLSAPVQGADLLLTLGTDLEVVSLTATVGKRAYVGDVSPTSLATQAARIRRINLKESSNGW